MSATESAHTERVAGLSVRVLSAGPAESEAPPVLVLHGWGASLDAVMSIVNGLAPTLRVLAPDLPGFGASEAPPRGWSVDDYADFVLELCRAQGLERFSIVGHSNGGRIGIALAARRPELVARMVLTNAAGLKPRRKAGYYGRVAVAKAGRAAGAVGGKPGRELQDRMRRRVASQDWLDAPESMRDTFRLLVGEDLGPRLADVKASTLLIWGDADEDTPLWMGERMEADIPDAALVVLHGGHFAYAERAGEFNRIAEHFLSRAR